MGHGVTVRARASLAVVALFAGLSLAPGALAQPNSDELGHRLVLRDCAMCHAVGRTGASPRSLAPAFRDLNRRYPLDSLAGALAGGTILGHPRMPQYHFSSDEIAHIVRYMKSIQSHQPA